MQVSRRATLLGAAGAPLLAAAGTAAQAPGPSTLASGGFPGKFRITGTYVNAAYTHPMPLDAAEAAQRYIQQRTDPGAGQVGPRNAKALFAKLINAAPSEIAAIPSTSYGESFVIGAVNLQADRSAGIVTDILHFDGGLYAYGELAKQGNPLTILPMTAEGRIDMNRLEAAVTPKTRLVAVSLVSMVNGFQHDLKTVCDIAHRRGALVYCDAIQGAGAVPIDVKASGVDFLACSTFKWLMGDFGYGFLYVRPDVLPKLKRAEFGYHQPKTLAYHALPGDPPGAKLFEATPDDATAAGRFEVGSLGTAAEVAVGVSLKNMLDYGVDRIQRERQPLMDRLFQGLSGKYKPITPPGSASPIIAFDCPSAVALRDRLKAAKITIQLYQHRFRVSPSVYNTPDDIERLIAVLTA